MAEARPGGFLSLLARGLCSSSQFGKCADALAPADKTAFIDGSLPSCVSAGHPFQNQKQGVPIVISQRPNRRQLQGCDLSGFGCDSILVTFSRPWRSKWWNNDNRSKFCFLVSAGHFFPHGGWGVLEALSILTAQFSDWMLG